jgi:RNA polymerase sigma-70 factor (ECF subfamily)
MSQRSERKGPNERAAFDETILVHLDELYGTAVRLTRNRSDAEDLVQEAVMRAWAFWDRFELGTNARAWMHRILVNTFINGYRRKKREREILAEARVHEVERPMWNHQDRKKANEGFGDEVSRALDSLPDEFRIVLMMVDMNDLSYREVADALACPIGTVMSRLHRARRRMQDELESYAVEAGFHKDQAAA